MEADMLRRVALANADTANMVLEMEAMKAQNKAREIVGDPPLYTYDDFMALGNHNRVVEIIYH